MRAAGQIGFTAVSSVENGVTVVFVLLTRFFRMEIRNFVRLAAFEHRTVREDCRRGHRNGGMNVERMFRLLSFADAVEEHSCRNIVGAAVTACKNLIFVRIVPARVVAVDFFHTFGLRPAVVAEHDLRAHTAEVFDLTFGTADTVSVVVCPETGTARDAENGTIVVLRGDDRRAVAVEAGVRNVAFHGSECCKCRDRLRRSTRRTHYRTERMGDIIGTRAEVAPVLGEIVVRPLEADVHRIARMVVFAFRVDDLTERAGLCDTLHFAVEDHLGIVFRKEVNHIRIFFGRPDEFNTFRHRPVADALGENVESLFYTADGIRRVFMEVVRQNDRVHIVFDKFIEVSVQGRAAADPIGRIVQTFFVEVADRRDLTAEPLEISGKVCAASRAEHTDFDRIHKKPPWIFVSF